MACFGFDANDDELVAPCHAHLFCLHRRREFEAVTWDDAIVVICICLQPSRPWPSMVHNE